MNLLRKTQSTVTLLVLCGAILDCRGLRHTVTQPGLTASEKPQSGEVIPTRYVADRFFATLRTARGDSVTLFVDTGDNSRLWDSFAARVGLPVETVGVNTSAVRVAPLPAFLAGHGVPTPLFQNGKIVVTPPQDYFDTLMSRGPNHTDGQLGWNWFAGRVWTLDYPAHRLLLHDQPVVSPRTAHAIAIGFPTDSAGHRTAQLPRIAVVIDGDSLSVFFDIGATVWLTDRARAAIGDGGPSERAASLISQFLFDRWRTSHPEWRVIDSVDASSKVSMIEVPTVRIAGFDVGPVWFRNMPGFVAPPVRRPGVPPEQTRITGTVGGDVFRAFVITLDYPRGMAWFSQESR